MQRYRLKRVLTVALAGMLILGSVMPTMAGPASDTTGQGTSGVFVGAQNGITDNSGTANIGPKVEEITLGESYHDEFDCYAESFNGAAYFYTNINNNGMTDKGVYVDIPANITYTMTKDGIETPYISNTTLSAYGSYTFKLKVVKDASAPLSEQVYYSAVFNFRIARRVKAKEDTSTSGNGFEFKQSSYDQEPVKNAYDYDKAKEDEERIKELEAQLAEQKKEEPKVNEETVAPEDPFPEGYDPNKPAEVKTELSFSKVSGLYTKSFDDGTAFSASVPNGMPVNFAVHLYFDNVKGRREAVQITRDGEAFEIPDDNVINVPGQYVVTVPDGNGTYDYTFSIFSHPVNQPDSITLPKGCELRSLTCNGQDAAFVKNSEDRAVVRFEKDGVYNLNMVDENLETYNTEITYDTVAPDVSISIEKGVATFIYADPSEIDHIYVNNGKQTMSYPEISTIDKPGTYSVDVFDRAGNSSHLDFKLKKSVNIASVMAILLILGIIGGGAAFFWKVRNNSAIK